MTWDAHKISDRAYHRRRLILMAIMGAVGLGLIAMRAKDIVSGNADLWSFLSLAVWLGFTLYAIVVGRVELRALQQTSGRK